LLPLADSRSISSKSRKPVSKRHRPQNVPPPIALPLTRLWPSASTLTTLTPEPMLTSK
jgi:hypothetical protein